MNPRHSPSDAESAGDNNLETTTEILDLDKTSHRTKSLDAPPSDPTTTIKREQEQHNGDGEHDGLGSDALEATLRPDPPASKKRRESEAELQSATATPEPSHDHHHSNKKRKRGGSPPWRFPVAGESTLKSADGRRVSARHSNVGSIAGTPALSGSEADSITAKSAKSRGRSQSQSTNVANSRPASPPWKKFAPDAPTSIIVDGQRKSGRANKDLVAGPKRVSPRSKKQVDKLGTDTIAAKRNAETKPAASKSMGGSSRKSEAESKESKKQTNADSKKQAKEPDRSASFTAQSASDRKIADLKAQIAALQPTRSFSTPTKTHSSLTDGVNSSTGKSKAKAKREEAAGKVGGSLRKKVHRPSDASLESPERSKPSPKLKLKVAPRRIIPPPNPQAQVPSPPQESIWKLLEDFDLQERLALSAENERGPKTVEELAEKEEEDVTREAASRKRLVAAAQPGGALSAENISLFRDDHQPEPPPQYGHHDHLTAHALHLRTLQIREKTYHRQQAKKLAQEAVEKWKLRNGPTEEDLIAERNKIIDNVKKQIVVDIRAKWEMVEAHVKDMKRREYEKEQERVRAEKLERTLQRSQALLAKQRSMGDVDGDAESDIEMNGNSSTSDVDDSDADAEEDDEDQDEESNMDSEDEEDEDGEMSEEAMAAYEAQRKAELEAETEGLQNAEVSLEKDDMATGEQNDAPKQSPMPEPQADGEVDESENADAMEVDAVPQATGGLADLLFDDDEADDDMSADESADADSEDYDSDEDMSSTGDEAEIDNNDDEEDEDTIDVAKRPPVKQNPLLDLYSDLDQSKGKDGGLPTPMTSVENGGDNDNPRPQSEARSDSPAEAGAADEMEDVTISPRNPKCIADAQKETALLETDGVGEPESKDVEEVQRTPDLPGSGQARTLVPVPRLLRGTLRSYQHAGMDWLASLYRVKNNGILADEMGLGKTIQTISLLAHLAEEHEVWETHLVVVPTSVILNWVTEFQKFLPGFRVLGYYGTAEERAFKRKHWTGDPHHEDKSKRGYNVIITSYNVASQDINAIRGQKWHFLILDEAHNIRNFQSQKWQLLIRLKTKARLLLTGTPLQNDLSEVWSLLTFLATGGEDGQSTGALDEYLQNWKEPVKEIFDQGVQKISEKAQLVIDNLHRTLRPHLLRRKKDEVEKDLPKKIERVVVCKLSKRQRQLYQDYMGLASTRDTLAKGSGVQAGAVLLSLRKVCNHPDLFDPRPIQTSFAMEYSPLEGYSKCERLIRRMLGWRKGTPTKLMVTNNTALRRSATNRSRQLAVGSELKRQLNELDAAAIDSNPDPSTIAGFRALQRLRLRERKMQQLRSCIQSTESALEQEPLVPADLREVVTISREQPYLFKSKLNSLAKVWHGQPRLGHRPLRFEHLSDWLVAKDTRLQREVATLDSWAEKMQEVIVRFAFVPPAATVPILDYAISPNVQAAIRASPMYPVDCDFGHEARVRSSIAFPDKRLLIYDAGKLQRLTHLLRDLQSRGSRSLIFTQMTGTLDVLERFLSLMNLPYLRLDGSTPVERRQLYSSEFNRPDCKYQCMILSSRAGGVGLNLTGASSVIFYDLDWNPQMDRQCMDRAHRIGQTKDVEVYKLVSEKTVEENILRRANQKSLLDQTVIQDGHFTTEYEVKENGDQIEGAIEALLGGNDEATTAALASVEDKEDVQAAVQASKEDRTDDVDFGRDSSKGPSKANTPGPGAAEDDPMAAIEQERKGHVDLYMIKHMERLLQGWVYTPPSNRLDKNGRDRSHRPKKRIR